MSIPSRAVQVLEEEYANQRNEAAQELYNALADVISAQQPSVETALYVVELLKFGILHGRIEAMSPGATATAQPIIGGWRTEREKRHGSGMEPGTS